MEGGRGGGCGFAIHLFQALLSAFELDALSPILQNHVHAHITWIDNWQRGVNLYRSCVCGLHCLPPLSTSKDLPGARGGDLDSRLKLRKVLHWCRRRVFRIQPYHQRTVDHA